MQRTRCLLRVVAGRTTALIAWYVKAALLLGSLGLLLGCRVKQVRLTSVLTHVMSLAHTTPVRAVLANTLTERHRVGMVMSHKDSCPWRTRQCDGQSLRDIDDISPPFNSSYIADVPDR